jgi:hypothetical protein
MRFTKSRRREEWNEEIRKKNREKVIIKRITNPKSAFP